MSPGRLLTRNEFREQTLARLGGRCCVPSCTSAARDAHHLLNRNLFHGPREQGGYFLDNGAALCPDHHQQAEFTLLSVKDLRTWTGINTPVFPEHLAAGTYDTFGNPVNDDGSRYPGEMFSEPAVQKALTRGNALGLFREPRYKGPRTPHLPWSAGRSDDDIGVDPTALAALGEIVVSSKIDGEAASIYGDGYVHARSVDSKPHPARAALKALAATFAHDIPQGWRITGEDAYAVHSIRYEALPAHFLVYGVWDRDVCLDWDTTVEWCELLGLTTVPVLYRGPMLPQAALNRLWRDATSDHESEGYVVRSAGSFPLARFGRNVMKNVRASHVRTDQHWMQREVEVNGLAR